MHEETEKDMYIVLVLSTIRPSPLAGKTEAYRAYFSDLVLHRNYEVPIAMHVKIFIPHIFVFLKANKINQ